jgi:hypothetical protein
MKCAEVVDTAASIDSRVTAERTINNQQHAPVNASATTAASCIAAERAGGYR